MLKKYIQGIARNEAQKILLTNYKEKLIFETKEKKELKEENKNLKDQLLSNDYYEIVEENKKLKKENEILQRSYNFINNNTLPDLESRVTSKERIATEINLMLNKEKRKVEELEQENEKLKNSLKGAKNKILELSSKDFTTNDIHIVQLEDVNSKIETIGNMVEKLVNENKKLKKELRDSKNGLNGANDIIKNMKQENEKLKQKLIKISNVISLRSNMSLYSLMSTIDTIRSILKES